MRPAATAALQRAVAARPPKVKKCGSTAAAAASGASARTIASGDDTANRCLASPALRASARADALTPQIAAKRISVATEAGPAMPTRTGRSEERRVGEAG